jgi:Tfp pilus assembly protein PilF
MGYASQKVIALSRIGQHSPALALYPGLLPEPRIVIVAGDDILPDWGAGRGFIIVKGVRHRWRLVRAGLYLAGAVGLAGCLTDPPPVDTQGGVPPITTLTIQENASVQYYPSDEPLRLGIEHFNRGDFGIAEKYFRDAVEKAPKDVSAWMGLAASDDRLGRFDLADRAYVSATRLGGETTAVLNNRGYSYMLRGDLGTARRYFLKALEREPGNPTILNNLKLLDGSSRLIVRSPDAP